MEEHVADPYNASRELREIWLGAGKPKQGPLFELHKNAKARCKYAIRYIQNNENIMCKESLAKKLSHLDAKSFWKEIKMMNCSSTPLPTTIEGVSGGAAIAANWKSHFVDLFNCHRQTRVNYTENVKSRYDEIFGRREEIEVAIKNLDKNKSCGLDGIYAEHLKYASVHLLDHLRHCFTSLLVHGVLPDSMPTVVLVPVIKDKAGNITSKDNYRPIALASIVSKVLETVYLIIWYANQKMCIRWGNDFSEPFGVSNGVRQGGILSPYLFNIYMDDVSSSLSTYNVGCYYSELIINHIMYADDLVLLAPSVAGLKGEHRQPFKLSLCVVHINFMC